MNDGKIEVIRKRPTQLSKYYLWLKYYGYWYIKSLIIDAVVITKMFITREVRLYYIYTTRELLVVNYKNYLQRVKIDGVEWALIKTKTETGYSYTKAERF